MIDLPRNARQWESLQSRDPKMWLRAVEEDDRRRAGEIPNEKWAAPAERAVAAAVAAPRAASAAPSAQPAPSPDPDGHLVSIGVLKRFAQIIAKAVREKVSEPTKASIAALQARTDKAVVALESAERRLSRHAEHLARLETRIKRLEK